MMASFRTEGLTQERMRVVLAAVGFWSAFVLLTLLDRTILSGRFPDGGAKFAMSLPVNIAPAVLGVVLSLAVWPVLKRASLWSGRRQAVTAVGLSVGLALPFETVFRLLPPAAPPVPLSWQNVVQAGLFWTIPFLLWSTGALGVLHQNALRERARRLAAAQAEARDAQIRALRYQVNPHFLHNTLNAIASLILSRRLDEAEDTVVQLSRFFRATLDSDPLVDQPLGHELELQRLYLAIEQVRFGDFLQVRFDVPAELESALVPPMILQPLVENTLKHALHGPGRMTTLTISARREAGALALTVRDDGRGVGCSPPDAGVGLRNVEGRLATRFPGASSMTLEGSQQGFAAHLTLPYRRAA